jgi:Tol biopolymer transport system component
MFVKINLRYYLPFCLSAALLAGIAGCAPVIQYSVRNVPREVTLSLTQVTTDKDSVAGCTVYWKKDKWTYDVRNRLSVSPDGSVMAFMNCRDSARGITMMMLDGSYKSFFRPALYNAIDPCISPDGKRIAFVGKDRENWNIYETAIAGVRGVRRITSEFGINVMPSYFRNQSYIIFTHADFSVNTGIPSVSGYITAASASTGAITKYGAGFSACPVPNSTKVVVVRYGLESQTTELWLVDLSSDTEKVIFSSKKRGVLDPSVSPDGSTVAFVSMTEEKNIPANLDIYTIGINGTNCIQRTFFEGSDICPRWAPSGKTLYFISQRGTASGTWNIWKINMETKSGTPTEAATSAKDTGKILPDKITATISQTKDTVAPVNPVRQEVHSDSTKKLQAKTEKSDSLKIKNQKNSGPTDSKADTASIIVKQPLDSAAKATVKPPATDTAAKAADKPDIKEW